MTIGKLRAAAYEALIGLLFLFPVLLVLNHYVWQMTLWQSAAWLLAAYAAGIAAGGLRLRRIAQWALMAAIAAGIGFLPYGFNVGLGAIVLAGAAAAAAWAGLRHRFGHRFSLGFCAAGLLLFVAASILALVHAPFRIYGGLVYGLGLVAVAVFFFKLNREQLDRAEMPRARGRLAAGKVAAVNRIGTGALLLLIVLLAHIRQLTEGLLAAYRALAAWIAALIPEPTDEPAPPEPAGPPPASPQLFPEQAEKAPLWEALEQILIHLFAAAGILLALALLYLFVVRIAMPGLRRWFAHMLGRRPERGGYVDETEKLAGAGFRELLKTAASRARRARPSKPADNRERIRQYYRDMLREAARYGYIHEESRTPLETERALAGIARRLTRPAGKLTALYNIVRYKEADVSDAELDDL